MSFGEAIFLSLLVLYAILLWRALRVSPRERRIKDEAKAFEDGLIAKGRAELRKNA